MLLLLSFLAYPVQGRSGYKQGGGITTAQVSPCFFSDVNQNPSMMAIDLQSPSRRRKASPDKASTSMPIEELKDADSERSPVRGIGFGEDLVIPSSSHVIKVLSPTKPTSASILQSGGVNICFHKLSLTASYMSKRMKRKTRRILKGKVASSFHPSSRCTFCI